jgi:hypothetical protein
MRSRLSSLWILALLSLSACQQAMGQDPIAHNKTIVIDEATVITGSFNFTKAAEKNHAENLLVICSPEPATQYTANWRANLEHSEKCEGKEKGVSENHRAERVAPVDSAPKSADAVTTGYLASTPTADVQSLAGKWDFRRDDRRTGEPMEWFASKLDGGQTIELPGTMDDAKLGISNPERPSLAGLYRPNTYEGMAWYERQIDMPDSWRGKRVTLFLERVRWVTRAWLDGKPVGEPQDSLIAPHVYDLGTKVSPGNHRITLCVDNTRKIDLGTFVSALYGGVNGNLNGIVGKIELRATDPVWIDNVQVYPDIEKHIIRTKMQIGNATGKAGSGRFTALIQKQGSKDPSDLAGKSQREVQWSETGGTVEFEVAFGGELKLWDEFSPNLYSLTIALNADGLRDEKRVDFGMRHFTAKGTQFTMNGRPLYLRGTLECQVFPKTGYPRCDVEWWRGICRLVKSYGLNLLRFHSWCPPEAAFVAADLEGIIIQAEAPQANVDAGQDSVRDAFTEAELLRMIRTYGNHPSFCLMTLGNEYGGKDALLSKWIEMLIKEDPRHLYSSASCAQKTANRQFTEDVFGRGIHGFGTRHDVRAAIAGEDRPPIGHEIGQWVVFPNFEEIKKYDGVFEARNFELIREDLRARGMLDQAPHFFQATGFLSALLYKEEIELLLRTPGFGGFSLLDLHDYPSQGTALIGLLDPFWESKGFITPPGHKRYCGPVVPLLRIDKRTFTANETLAGSVDMANFGPVDLKAAKLQWKITDAQNREIATGDLQVQDVPTGRLTSLGTFTAPLSRASAPCELKIAVSLNGTDFSNDWDIWVYPSGPSPQPPKDVLVTNAWDAETKAALAAGKKVLYLMGRKSKNSLPGSFLPVFWSPVWFPNQVPNTSGMLCDPKHPVFSLFPTEFYTNWQWYDLLNHSRALILDDTPAHYRPLVQVIDNFARNHKLASVFETRVGPGRMLVCSIDISSDLDKRPAAKQFARSLYAYLDSEAFNPTAELGAALLDNILAMPPQSALSRLGAKVISTDSEEPDNPAAAAIDGDPDTFWDTEWSKKSPAPPHEIVIELGQEVKLAGVTYLPRQDMSNGRIADFQIYTSHDGKSWDAPAASGRWLDDPKQQIVSFAAPVAARFLKFVAKSEVNGHAWAAIAELDVILAKP